jgi:peptide deformylase
MSDDAVMAGASDEVADTEVEPASPSASRPDGSGREAEQPSESFSEAERERRAAALAEVRTWGDPVLRSRASEVTEFGEHLGHEVERMVEIMRDAMGVGLAATQLGILRRLLVFQAGPDARATAVVNPEVEWASEDLAVAEEGCLSLPGIGLDVERPLHARIRGRDVHGDELLLEASGLEARVLQHEIDHLDGVLILDRTERDQRKAALRALREGETYSPHLEEDEAGGDDAVAAS